MAHRQPEFGALDAHVDTGDFAGGEISSMAMTRDDVIERLRSVEPVLRAHGVGALYLFGSYSRDEATPDSDLDVFVDASDETFYDLSNFMKAYRALQV